MLDADPADTAGAATARALTRTRWLALCALLLALASTAVAIHAVVRTHAPATALRIVDADGQARVLVDERGLVVHDARGRILLVAGESTVISGGQVTINASKTNAMISLSSSATMSSIVELRDGDALLQLATSAKDHGGHSGIAMRAGANDQQAGLAVDQQDGVMLGMSRTSVAGVADIGLSLTADVNAGPTLVMRTDTGAPAGDKGQRKPSGVSGVSGVPSVSAEPRISLSHMDHTIWQTPPSPGPSAH